MTIRTHKEFTTALLHGWPGKEWNAPGFAVHVNDVEWLDPSPKPTQQEVEAFHLTVQREQALAPVKAKLAQIDAASIRALREWVAKQPDAPQIIKDREAEAVAEREKLKDK